MKFRVMKLLKNMGRTTKPISAKSRGSNINLHPLRRRLLNPRKTVLEKDYGFNEVFDIFDEIDINYHEPNEYNSRTVNKINTKNEMLEYLKIMKWKLIDILSTPALVKKINNANYKGYVKNKLNDELNRRNTHHAEAILDYFIKFKRL